MPVKIRLQRHGKKGYAFFHVVIADGRAPRDGKFIEKIGTYNPNTNPATIELNNEKALQWLKNGAQPTDTTRAILSYKGVLLKLHLDKGVEKGALTAEQAEARYTKWLDEKQSKIDGKINRLAESRADQHRARLKGEQDRNAQRAAVIAAKNTPPAPEPVAEEAMAEVAEAEIPVVEETAPAETEIETPAAEAPEVVEEPAAEAEVPAVAEAETSSEEVEAPSAEEASDAGAGEEQPAAE